MTGVRGAGATPLYAIRSANRCDTCHIEPVGWENPPKSTRKCTLDCAVCHVSPAGGGLRTPSGAYYGKEVLPRWGERPGATVDLSKYISDENKLSDGHYRLFGGFSGWEKGTIPIEDVPDLYGDIDPDPTFSAGFDGRAMAYHDVGSGDVSVFPMQIEAYGSYRAHHNLLAYLDVGLASRRDSLDVVREGNTASAGAGSAADYLALREIFLMVDRLPDRTYVRAGRIHPIYGWRLADHTAFVRRDLGFDVDRQVYGVEAGWNRGYPYLNASVFAQGLAGWPGEVNPPGHGFSLNAGYRDLGWQAGLSHHQVFQAGERSATTGAQWALNLYPIVLMGEVDHRGTVDAAGRRDALFTYSEASWEVQWGLLAKVAYEWMDPDLTVADDHRNRISIGGEFHPYTYVHLEPRYRMSFAGGGWGMAGTDYAGAFVYDAASQQVSHDLMLIAHVWF